MKKLLLVIAIVFSMGMSSFAQTDGFFSEANNTWRDGDDWGWIVPILPGIDDDDDVNLPLGEGLLIMCTLGAGYAIGRKKKNQ